MLHVVHELASSDFSGRARRWATGLALATAGILTTQPLFAQTLPWTRVEVVPPSDVFSLHHQDTTLYAGTSTIVFMGANEGTSWTPTAEVDTAATAIEAVLSAGGALWVGTFGNGVFRSANNGSSWQPVDAGLTGLGSDDITELVEKSAKLYAGSSGAGIFVLDLGTPNQWSEFNAGLPVDIAGTIGALALHGTTLVAPAGPNGFVYRFPEGATQWQEVPIVPPFIPGQLTFDLITSAEDLFIATSAGVYRSQDDALTWTFASSGLVHSAPIFLTADGSNLFAGIDFLGNNHRLYRSADRGDSWQQIDEISGIFLYAIAVAGDKLFAARNDGLWWTPLATTGVSPSNWAGFKARYKRGSK